jgi:hypothetical protein
MIKVKPIDVRNRHEDVFSICADVVGYAEHGLSELRIGDWGVHTLWL